MEASETTVLVTGASGFIAMHCILQLLERGYKVRGTLREPTREAGLRKTFAKHLSADDRLEFLTADLQKEEGWDDAVERCTYVLHVASPFPRQPPKREDDIINIARNGTLRILKAAASGNVRRVVMTSTIAAIYKGHEHDDTKVFNEDDWATTDQDIGDYYKSKILAERAAWDFVNSLQGDDILELAVINPGLTFGPILNDHFSSSGELVYRLMRRKMPGCPDVGGPFVDVRDVADAHIGAMIIPEAAGKRFCCAIETAHIQDIALILAKHFKGRGYNIPTRILPNILVRFRALYDKRTRLVVKDLGRRIHISNERIKNILNWKPRTLEEMVVAMGESMIEQGVV